MAENPEKKAAKSKGRRFRSRFPEEERIRAFENALKDLLQDGETFLVQKNGDRVLIDVPIPGKTRYSPVRFLYPDLYGCLLSADKQISEASGCFVTCLGFIMAGALCLAVHLELSVFASLAPLRNIWVYFFVLICSSWITFWISELREKFAYRRVKTRVLKTIQDSEIHLHFLLAYIEDDVHVEKVSEYLKKEPLDSAGPASEETETSN